MYKLRILHPAAANRLRLLPVMHGMAGMLFLFNAIGIYNSSLPGKGIAVFFLLLGLISLLVPFVLRRIRNISGPNSLVRIIQIFACFSACLYFLSHLQPLPGVLLLLVGLGLAWIGWTEYRLFKPVYILLDQSGVTLPSAFSKRIIGWNEVNNVILRNDLLTVDQKNNKLLQLEVLDNVPDVKAAEINGFCKSRLQP